MQFINLFCNVLPYTYKVKVDTVKPIVYQIHIFYPIFLNTFNFFWTAFCNVAFI